MLRRTFSINWSPASVPARYSSGKTRVCAALDHADHASRTPDPPVLLQEFAPIPGAQPARRRAMSDQIKVCFGKFEHTQRVHYVKLHAIIDTGGCGLHAGELDHAVADIHADQQGNARIRRCGFNEPVAGAATHIDYALKARGIRLLRQHSTHCSGEQLILNVQTGHLCLAGTILDDIGARMFWTWLCLV